MNRLPRNILMLVCLLAIHGHAEAPITYGPAEDGGKLTVNGTSNLHDWSVETTEITGEVVLSGNKVTALSVGIPVKSLASDKDTLNKKMYKALAASDHPVISFVLSGELLAAPEDAGKAWLLPGKLTIVGKTLDVAVLSDVTLDEDKGLTLSGSLTLNMEGWGIDPPTALMGMARTAPEVTVIFEWKLAPVEKTK